MQTFLQLNDPAVQAALVGAIGSVLTGSIAALCAAIIGKQVTGRKRLREKLLIAQDDIEFLLEVERAHCDLHQKRDGASHKLTVRKIVRSNGLEWSGKFTPSRVAYNDGPGRRYSKS